MSDLTVTKRSGRRARTRRKVPRSVREPQMLDAAVRVFAERGYHGASMDDIARGAGVTKPMVYSYFGPKEKLYLACIDHAVARMTEAVTHAGHDEPEPERQLWLRLLAFFSFVHEHSDEWRVLRREAAASGGPFSDAIARARGRWVRLVADQLEESARSRKLTTFERGELEPLAQGLVGASEALSDWAVDHPRETPEAMAQRLMNLVWMGFKDLTRGRVWTP